MEWVVGVSEVRSVWSGGRRWLEKRSGVVLLGEVLRSVFCVCCGEGCEMVGGGVAYVGLSGGGSVGVLSEVVVVVTSGGNVGVLCVVVVVTSGGGGG